MSTKGNAAVQLSRMRPLQSKVLELAYKHYRLTLVFGLSVLLYLLVMFATPPDPVALHRYHLTAASATMLSLTIVLPYIVIWLIAVSGYLRLRDYGERVRASEDGAAFREISQGIFWLTFWLPSSALLGAVAAYIHRVYPAFTAPMVAVNNYGSMLTLFLAFILTYRGTRHLLATIQVAERVLPEGIATFAGFAGLYIFLVLQDPARRIPVAGVSAATYYLPDWLTVATIALPRLFMWYLGFQAAYNLCLYRAKVRGKIYRQALTSLAIGLAGVVAVTVLLSCFQSVPLQLSHLHLAAILPVLYALLLLIALGYVFISRGAQNLQRIEDV